MKKTFKLNSQPQPKPASPNYAILWVSAHPEAFAAAKAAYQGSKKSTVGMR